MSVATQNEMARLRNERDTAAMRLAHTRGLLDAALEREAALAAHVERLLEAATPKTIDLIRCGIGANYSGHLYDKALAAHRDPLVQALEDTPTTSLDRRDALKQAEAFSTLLGVTSNGDSGAAIREVVFDQIRKLRRQAEGANNA